MDDRWNTTSVAETHGDVITLHARILTIIISALVIGQLVFGGVVLFALDAWNKPPTGKMMSLFAAGLAVQLVATAYFVASFVAKSGVAKANGDVDKLLRVYQVNTIVGAAFLEGSAFLNLTALMLEHHKWSLILVGVGIFLLLTMIPSSIRITNWVDETRRRPTE